MQLKHIKEENAAAMFAALQATLEQHHPIEERDWLTIQAQFQPKGVHKNNSFLSLGSVCRSIGFVYKGALRTSFIDENGVERTSHFAFERDFAVVLSSFRNQTPSPEEITAIEESLLLVLNKEGLSLLQQRTPVWNTIYQQLIEHNFICLEQRNLALQHLSAKEKYLHLLENTPHIAQRVPVTHIASYLGITIETLSRIRKSLAQ